MKPILFIFSVLAISIAACTKNATPTTPGMDTVDTSMAMNKFSGMFMNGPYGTVSGKVNIYFKNNQYLLALENVNISNGPDLHVYVSKELQPLNFYDLGKLQSVAGNQVYTITGTPDFSQYKYALIHCQRFNHLFGSAELK